MSGDLIRREDLIKKIFPYGMPDGGNYPINARAVMEAAMGVAAVATENNVGGKWVPVSERLPEDEKLVLCLTNTGWHWIARWNDCGDEMWCDGESWSSKTYITHWMPLPEPPEVSECE